jgi:hypothetical protein
VFGNSVWSPAFRRQACPNRLKAGLQTYQTYHERPDGLDFLAVQWFVELYFARRKGNLKSERIDGTAELVGNTADVIVWQRAGSIPSCWAAEACSALCRVRASADTESLPQMV